MVTRNGLATSELVMAPVFRMPVQARTGDGSASSAMAIGRRREIMAVDADRHHGRSISPGIPRDALRSAGAGCRLRAAGAARLAVPLLRLSIPPAPLTSWG